MKINGRDAVSGTIVVGAGERGTLDFPFGSFATIFNPGVSPPEVTLTSNPPTIVFNGTDNPLGLATSLTIPLVSGVTKYLTLMIYAVGDGDEATRVIHYTVS